MMETFIVLGLCFILYEALDFFQGCMHSNSPSTTDQIDAYRRQLDEQRQQQQQEQFLANLTPLLGAQLATLSQLNESTSSVSATPTSATPTASTASVISDLHALQQQQSGKATDHSVSTPALNGGFRPAHRSVYESQELQATSSLPRDYYYVQQQQRKNKKSLLSKFSSSSDNRIYPETASVLGAPVGVITTQPSLGGNTFDNQTVPSVVPPSSIALELKRAILSSDSNNTATNNDISNKNSNEVECARIASITASLEEQKNSRNAQHRSKDSLNSTETDSEVEAEEEEDDDSSDSASAGSASLASCGYSSDQEAADEREFAAGSCSSSHADFREIECERLRRKCVSVKRIYSISEKF